MWCANRNLLIQISNRRKYQRIGCGVIVNHDCEFAVNVAYSSVISALQDNINSGQRCKLLIGNYAFDGIVIYTVGFYFC